MQKQDITTFPFETFTLDNMETRAKETFLAEFNSWMLPQLLALFGKLKVTRNDDGKVLCKPILDQFDTPYMRGIWIVVNKLARSKLVKSQISSPTYGALTPLILAGLKKYQGINYSEYDSDGLHWLMPDKLYEAITTDYDNSITPERLLELRLQGLTHVSGANAGTLAKSTSRWTPKGISDTELGPFPPLTRTMLTQLWVADPSLRDQYMILDPVYWDNIPKPLISVDVMIEEPVKPVKPKKAQELPWL